MNEHKNRLYIGALICIIGITALLINTNVLRDMDDLIWATLLLLGSLFFFGLYNRDKSKWWPLLPATLLGVLGIGIFLQLFVPSISQLFGAAFMYALFAVFAFLFTKEKTQWWAVIPAGACFTLGTVIVVETFNLLDSDLVGAVFLLGMGLTFFFLWSLRREIKNLNWAIWPSSILFLLALVVFVNEINWLGEEFIFPILIMLVGIIVILHGFRKK